MYILVWEFKEVARTLCADLSLLFCHKPAVTLFSKPLKLTFCPDSSPYQWSSFPGWETLSFSTAPYQRWKSPHDSFFFFLLIQLQGDLFCNFDLIKSSASLQQVFYENCSTCRYIFNVVVEAGSSTFICSTVLISSPTAPFWFNRSFNNFLRNGRGDVYFLRNVISEKYLYSVFIFDI